VPDAARCEGSARKATGKHGDHMNNVYVKDGAIRVLDWGDASIAHPFFSLFETFRFLEELNGLSADGPLVGEAPRCVPRAMGIESSSDVRPGAWSRYSSHRP
jgi:hypothetical protein